ncbi:MAG: PIN domain-containing protein [Methylocystis sp.]|nr:PIN domain-containing protein [Methylocystis sp.]MCA3582214.1 PIN domain-containing protein [Methylocystis sp.]MCA3587894.1 PIN domain-containing protein [Methylocystis sp.]MCA3590275.1 PIN domain-containing protein [Methylocystis sp.]
MKLVVDASVVVKWFVEEEGQAEAIAILERGDECFAPDFVLVEVAGALDKKLKSGTVTREQAFEAITAIQSKMTMVAGIRLIESALDLAAELNHPVADCLYLACALELDTSVVSADRLFIEKARARGYLSRAFMLGHEADPFSGQLVVKFADLQRIRELHDQVKAVFASVEDQVKRLSGRFHIVQSGDMKPAFDSPAYQRLIRFLDSLDRNARDDVIALCWLGRDYNKETWEELRAHAASFYDDHLDTNYIISKLAHLSRGLEWLEAHMKTTGG